MVVRGPGSRALRVWSCTVGIWSPMLVARAGGLGLMPGCSVVSAAAVEAAVVAAPAAAVVVVILVVRARLGAVAEGAAVQETAAAAGGTSAHPGEQDQADEDQEHCGNNDHRFIVTLAGKYASAAVACDGHCSPMTGNQAVFPKYRE
jgi:hypothetical protein